MRQIFALNKLTTIELEVRQLPWKCTVAEVLMFKKSKPNFESKSDSLDSKVEVQDRSQIARSRKIHTTDRTLAVKDTSAQLRKVDSSVVANKLGAKLVGDAPK